MQSIEFCHRFVEMYITNLSTHVDRLAVGYFASLSHCFANDFPVGGAIR